MANFVYILFFLSSAMLDVTIAQGLDYSRLEILGVSCFPNDTCSSSLPSSFSRTCQCDDLCQIYDDCCIDANRIASRRPLQKESQSIKCSAYQSVTKGVYIVSICHKGYRGSTDIRDNCENFEDIRDPLTAAPVTDITINVTYKNRYCAECNHAKPQNLRSWGVTVECSEIPDNTSIPRVDSTYVQDNLVYVETGEYSNTWGFYYRPRNARVSGKQFYPCNIPFVLPDALKNYVRECVPNLISTCAPSWERNLHHDLCQAYLAPVFTDNKLYRNPDCAYCNGKSLEKLRCSIPELVITGRGKKPAMSFTLLLDVNMSDGNKVGEIKDDRCPEKEKWDPFFKKCRALVCAIPGYKLRNNKCIRP